MPWPIVAPTFPFTRLDTVEVFALEDTAAQIIWRGLPEGTVGAVLDGMEHMLGEGGGPGAGELTGLRPDTSHAVEITVDDRVVCRRTIHTEPALDGSVLGRVATIGDLHLGEPGFGLLKKMRERPEPGVGYPLRCARAAVVDAVAWGADLLVVKGDITHLGQAEHWDVFDQFLADVPIPIVAIPGNHDTFKNHGSLDATTELRRRGLFPEPVQRLDLDGARLVAVDTTSPRRSWGRIRSRTSKLCEAVDTDLPALVFMHHHLETHWYPRIWPMGTPRREGADTLNAMLDVNPDLLLSSGHTHRNRTRRHGSAIITEVGSTKDHPGVWAGYAVHANGVRQVVRRVADPSCLAWTDRTHAAVGGIWGLWSPGRVADRCLTHRWSRAAVSPAPPHMATLKT